MNLTPENPRCPKCGAACLELLSELGELNHGGQIWCCIWCNKTLKQPKMNLLESYITKRLLDEPEAMNALQAHGVISDNAIFAADVPDTDGARAIAWLERQRGDSTGTLL